MVHLIRRIDAWMYATFAREVGGPAYEGTKNSGEGLKSTAQLYILLAESNNFSYLMP